MNTQRHSSTVAEQLARRRHKNFTIENIIEANVGVLLSLQGCGDGQREPTSCSTIHTIPLCWSYCDRAIPFCGNTVRMEGAYTVEVSAASDHPSPSSGEKNSRTFDIVWKYRARNLARSTIEETFFFQLRCMPTKMTDRLVRFGP